MLGKPRQQYIYCVGGVPMFPVKYEETKGQRKREGGTDRRTDKQTRTPFKAFIAYPYGERENLKASNVQNPEEL